MVISVCKWFLVPALFLLSPKQGSVHPMYVSVTEVNHNALSKSVEISCKMFTDDLESTINRLYKTKIDITTAKDSLQVSGLIVDYIRKHLQIKIDGKVAGMQFIGFERENGAVWSYLQADKFATARKIEIMNDLLYESFDSQMGIIHVTVNGKRQSTKLSNPEKNAVFEFQGI